MLRIKIVPTFFLALFGAFVLSASVNSCAVKEMPFKGFSTQSSLANADQTVMSESVGGSLDPNNLAKEDQRYSHNGKAYNRPEEGYYQWGHKLYEMGYRDEWYIRDLAPKAFRKTLLGVYDQAITDGFSDAADGK